MSGFSRAYNILRAHINHEWDRLRNIDWDSAEAELDSPSTSQSQRPIQAEIPNATPVDPKVKARNILGVTEKSSYDQVRKTYEKLHKRSDPANFPPGSEEQRQAAYIQKRIVWAYQTLSDGVDVTEKRFRSLELD